MRSRRLMRTHDKPGHHNVEGPTARTYPSPNFPSPNTTSSPILPQLAGSVFQSRCRSVDRNNVTQYPLTATPPLLVSRAYLIQVSLEGYSANTSAFLPERPLHSRRVSTIRHSALSATTSVIFTHGQSFSSPTKLLLTTADYTPCLLIVTSIISLARFQNYHRSLVPYSPGLQPNLYNLPITRSYQLQRVRSPQQTQ